MTSNILHRLYLGLNDKDTKKQVIDIDHAKVAIGLNASIIGIDGYTIIDGQGFYTHTDGNQVEEATIIIELLFTDYDKVVTLATELKQDLNQESIGYQAIKLDKVELL